MRVSELTDPNRAFIRYFSAGLRRIPSFSLNRSQKYKPELQVIDLFCGCGGMSLGFAVLGGSCGVVELIGGVDIDRSSTKTYAQNFHVPAMEVDVQEMAEHDSALNGVLNSLKRLDRRIPLVLIGCAPCQGFSGHRKRNWNIPDERNNLISAFSEVALRISPDYVIMENVPELLSTRYWPYFRSFKENLEAYGYTVSQSILNAAEYGVPQERFRTLVVASKGRRFHMPTPVFKPNQFRTVRDAIGDLPFVDPGVTWKDDSMHRSAAHRASTLRVIKSVPKDGGSRPNGIGPKSLDRVKGFYDVYGRLPWNKPAITITHYARNPASGRFIHPEQDRGLTMREAARLQSFPDSFRFNGTFDDVFRQIGEAVPPALSLAVAAAVLESVRGETGSYPDRTQVTAPVADSYSGVIAGIKTGRGE